MPKTMSHYRVSPEDRQKIAKSVKRLKISEGSHNNFRHGHCVMEIVANCKPTKQIRASWTGHHGHTDHPYHADAFLTPIMITVNDIVDGDNRQLLAEVVPWLVGSASHEWLSRKRANMLVQKFVKRLASKLGSACNELCPVAALIEKNELYAAVERVQKVRQLVMLNNRCEPGVSSTLQALTALSDLVNNLNANEVRFSVYAPLFFRRVVQNNNFHTERENLRFFIKSMIEVLQFDAPMLGEQ